MTEATADDVPSDAEVQDAERPLEKTAGTNLEDRPIDRENYNPQAGKGRYAKTIEYKKTSKNSDSKPSANSSESLEKVLANALADSEAIGSEHGVDQAEVFSSILSQRMLYSSNSEDESAKKAVKGYETRQVPDSLDGVHVIIAYNDPETGKLCLSFEKKPANYPIAKYAGTLSLYGGSLGVGESPNEGLGREIWEEDRASYKIIIKALNETRWKVGEVKKDTDGVPSTTHIWLAYIRDPTEVRSYLSSKTAEGDKTSLSLEEMLKTKDSDFAFGFGPIVRGFAGVLSENHGKKYTYAPLSSAFPNPN